VTAEESETPPFGPGTPGAPGAGAGGAESQGRRPEGDLFAERRARRSAESGEIALTRRAEAAEATVQTLEIHVATLQQRLLEAEGERRRLGELLEAERTVALEREQELRRVKQREYAEQQLRVEAEERLLGADRDSRAEIQGIARRLSESEREAADLAGRLAQLQQRLADAEHAAAGERSSTRRAEADLQLRLSGLEARASEIQLGLEAERAARERSEALLQEIRAGHLRMETLLAQLRTIAARLGQGLRQSPAPAPADPKPPVPADRGPQIGELDSAGEEIRGEEMAQALAAAVERLRARADAAPAPLPPESAEPAGRSSEAAGRPAHKHSMSLIGRVRNRRKQRREA
jgi:DNA repair exonuclease SbcCD ATPase subunit